MSEQIPRLSFREYDTDLPTFAQKLGTAFENFGFVEIYDHPVPASLIAETLTTIAQVFDLPQEVKKKYHLQGKGGARGYTPFGIEKAKDSPLVDLKEFWHVGREVAEGHALASILMQNVWPQEIPDFQKKTTALYQEFETFGAKILRAFATYTHLGAEFFDNKINIGDSILRPLHYPPIDSVDSGALRAAPHEDINVITLLVDASQPGLEVLSKTGAWIPVKSQDGGIICNIGDMLQRMTNQQFPSTTHRVSNPTGKEAQTSRYSIPFFLHFNPEVSVAPHPQFIDQEHPNLYPQPMTAHEYLLERLREIGLLK